MSLAALSPKSRFIADVERECDVNAVEYHGRAEVRAKLVATAKSYSVEAKIGSGLECAVQTARLLWDPPTTVQQCYFPQLVAMYISPQRFIKMVNDVIEKHSPETTIEDAQRVAIQYQQNPRYAEHVEVQEAIHTILLYKTQYLKMRVNVDDDTRRLLHMIDGNTAVPKTEKVSDAALQVLHTYIDPEYIQG